MSEQLPSIGRIVHYRLSAQDVEQIMRRRTTGERIAERMKVWTNGESVGPPALPSTDPLPPPSTPDRIVACPAGAQAHIGNEVHEGDTFPMLIVRVWGPSAERAVNGQVFLDSNDVFWATSRTVGDQPGTFSWPTRG